MAKLVDSIVNRHASTCVLLRVIGYAILAISMMIVLCGGEIYYIGFIISLFSLAFLIPASVFELTALSKKARDKILKGELENYKYSYNKAKEIHDEMVRLLQQFGLKLEDFQGVNSFDGRQENTYYTLYEYNDYVLYSILRIETLMKLNSVTLEDIIDGNADAIYFGSAILGTVHLKDTNKQYALGKKSGLFGYETVKISRYVRGKKPSKLKMMVNEDLFGTAYAVVKYQEELEKYEPSHYEYHSELLLNTEYGEFRCSTYNEEKIQKMLKK